MRAGRQRKVSPRQPRRDAVKVQEFAYQVAVRTLELLEQTQHYKIPDATRKDVTAKVLAEVDDLIKKAK